MRVAATVKLRNGHLYQLLQDRGWSQNALARELGVDATVVSQWMRFRGRRPRNEQVVRKLMELTLRSEEELFPLRIYGAKKADRPVTEITAVGNMPIQRLLEARRPIPALPSPEVLYDETEREALVRNVLGTLPPREQTILEHRFGLNGQEPQSAGKIGRLLGLSAERVRQLERQGLQRLQTGERRDQLLEVAQNPEAASQHVVRLGQERTKRAWQAKKRKADREQARREQEHARDLAAWRAKHGIIEVDGELRRFEVVPPWTGEETPAETGSAQDSEHDLEDVRPRLSVPPGMDWYAWAMSLAGNLLEADENGIDDRDGQERDDA